MLATCLLRACGSDCDCVRDGEIRHLPSRKPAAKRRRRGNSQSAAEEDVRAGHVNIKGKISTKDDTHPPAFREVVLDIDKNRKINTKGLPTCKGRSARGANHCLREKSLRQSGSRDRQRKARQIAFPEQPPIPVKSPITVFNGGTKGVRPSC